MLKIKAAIIATLSIFSFDLLSADQSVRDFKDLNGDGKQDVFYQYEENGYFELTDTNFDGKIDISVFYDNNDKIVSSRQDDDFDGYLETAILYRDGVAKLSWVDLDGDELADIVFSYEEGILKKGERYYESVEAEIGLVKFEYGYPSLEIKKKAGVSKKQFHASRVDDQQ